MMYSWKDFLNLCRILRQMLADPKKKKGALDRKINATISSAIFSSKCIHLLSRCLCSRQNVFFFFSFEYYALVLYSIWLSVSGISLS